MTKPEAGGGMTVSEAPRTIRRSVWVVARFSQFIGTSIEKRTGVQ